MLRFFKKRKEKGKPSQKWRIPVDTSYRLIDNGDSIQFVNADQSIILYFSFLTFSGDSLLSDEILTKIQPSVNLSDEGWRFKGTRQDGNELLICVFTFTNEGDEALVKELFASIVYIGK